MRTLAIDIETYSSVSLQKCGVYAYAQSPDFELSTLPEARACLRSYRTLCMTPKF